MLLSALVLLAGTQVGRRYMPEWVQERASAKESRAVVVECAGSGVRPGVYLFSNAPTVAEACARVGVPREVVMANAEEVVDSGALLRLSEADSRVQVERQEMAASTRLLFGIPLDLNKVCADELEHIEGIGPCLAKAIIDYRNAHGPFRTVGELEKVRGIGRKKLAVIGRDLRVGEEVERLEKRDQREK